MYKEESKFTAMIHGVLTISILFYERLFHNLEYV